MSRDETGVDTERVLRTRKVDPLLTIAFTAGLGVGSALFYKAITAAASGHSFAFYIIGGSVLVIAGIVALVSGGWRPLSL